MLLIFFTVVPPKKIIYKGKSSMFVVGKLRLELTHLYLNIFPPLSVSISGCPIHKTTLDCCCCGFFFFLSSQKKVEFDPKLFLHVFIFHFCFYLFHRTAISAITIAWSSLILQSMSYRSFLAQQHQRGTEFRTVKQWNLSKCLMPQKRRGREREGEKVKKVQRLLIKFMVGKSF